MATSGKGHKVPSRVLTGGQLQDVDGGYRNVFPWSVYHLHPGSLRSKAGDRFPGMWFTEGCSREKGLEGSRNGRAGSKARMHPQVGTGSRGRKHIID